MKEAIHKVKDEYVILRFDESEHDWTKNKRSEYRTWEGWKPWLANAKRYWFEDAAAQALVRLRVLSKKDVW